MNYKSKEFLIKSKKEISRDDLLLYIKELEDFEGLFSLQLFNHQLIISKNQIESAIWHAIQGYNSKNMISKELGLEILIYLSGQRQIAKAISKFGIPKTNLSAGLIIVGENDANLFNEILSSIKQVFHNRDLTLEPFNPQFETEKIPTLITNYELGKNYKKTGKKEIERLILSKIALLRINTYQ
ncbi:MAG: KEOPS complex subunit Cgi121 [Candidatus Hodarchaeales archaeon]|jgi:tRNA threonylcarbamoyladenosine modification (KEOPS) complex Cgi121 subunit